MSKRTPKAPTTTTSANASVRRDPLTGETVGVSPEPVKTPVTSEPPKAPPVTSEPPKAPVTSEPPKAPVTSEPPKAPPVTSEPPKAPVYPEKGSRGHMFYNGRAVSFQVMTNLSRHGMIRTNIATGEMNAKGEFVCVWVYPEQGFSTLEGLMSAREDARVLCLEPLIPPVDGSPEYAAFAKDGIMATEFGFARRTGKGVYNLVRLYPWSSFPEGTRKVIEGAIIARCGEGTDMSEFVPWISPDGKEVGASGADTMFSPECATHRFVRDVAATVAAMFDAVGTGDSPFECIDRMRAAMGMSVQPVATDEVREPSGTEPTPEANPSGTEPTPVNPS